MPPKDSKDNIARTLELIRADKSHEELDSQYNEPIESNKEIGAPTNNVLLRAILDEQKRTNRYVDATIHEFRNLSTGINHIVNSMSSLTTTMQEMTDTMKDQMDIQASMKSSMYIPEETTTNASKSRRATPEGGEWYYHSFKLANKFTIMGAILMHLADIIKLRLEVSGKYYPDSVDCSFTLFSTCISKVSDMRCGRSDVEYRNKIDITDKKDQAYNVLLPLIASKSPLSPTTLREEQLTSLMDPRLRNVMQDVEWIRQRICKLEGILSPQQCDIFSSLRFPIVKDGELNWDPSCIHIRRSHHVSQEIETLHQSQKYIYAKAIVRGKDIAEAYEEAANSK